LVARTGAMSTVCKASIKESEGNGLFGRHKVGRGGS